MLIIIRVLENLQMNFVLGFLNLIFGSLRFYDALHFLIYDNNLISFLFYESFCNPGFSYIPLISLLIYTGNSFPWFCMIFALNLSALYYLMRKFFFFMSLFSLHLSRNEYHIHFSLFSNI